MGTNFYLLKKLSLKKKEEAIKAISTDDYELARDILGDSSLRVHIGKRSCGWKFLWNPNDFKYYEPNAESLKAWLQSGIIVDEYGKEYPYDEFIREELSGFLQDELMDLKSYYEKSKDREEYYSRKKLADIDSYTRKYKVYPNIYGEFYIPGGSISKYNLRFTMDTEYC